MTNSRDRLRCFSGVGPARAASPPPHRLGRALRARDVVGAASRARGREGARASGLRASARPRLAARPGASLLRRSPPRTADASPIPRALGGRSRGGGGGGGARGGRPRPASEHRQGVHRALLPQLLHALAEQAPAREQRQRRRRLRPVRPGRRRRPDQRARRRGPDVRAGSAARELGEAPGARARHRPRVRSRGVGRGRPRVLGVPRRAAPAARPGAESPGARRGDRLPPGRG